MLTFNLDAKPLEMPVSYQFNPSANDAGQDAKRAALDTVDTIKTAASDVSEQAWQSTSQVVSQVQQAGSKVVEATQTYARDALDLAGRKVDDVKSQLETARITATQYINEDPIRAVTMAAIGSAVLTAVLISLTRRRGYDD